MRLSREWITTLASVAFVAAALSVGFLVQRASSQPTVLSPFQTVLTVSNSLVTAAVPANPSRKGLIICNGNATLANNVYVGFGAVSPTVGTGLIIPGGLSVASCWYALPGVGASPTTGVGAQINLIATASTSVSIFEF